VDDLHRGPGGRLVLPPDGEVRLGVLPEASSICSTLACWISRTFWYLLDIGKAYLTKPNTRLAMDPGPDIRVAMDPRPDIRVAMDPGLDISTSTRVLYTGEPTNKLSSS
jgi:hypothetical protein